jgi:diguanylate cyclase (GGDEF)-like protein
MKTDPHARSPETRMQVQSLSKALEQCEHVRGLVVASAEELSSLRAALKQALANHAPLPEVEKALAKSETVEGNVQAASEELAAVNRALADELRNRAMIDHQLAAAIEQKEGASHAAFHDVLTGLANRALFKDRLEHGLAQAKRNGWTLAVMFLDLDDFKAINDSHGHDAGDCVLQTIALRLKSNTRGDDTVSRHGGDEFLYLLTQVREEKDIPLIAEKIVEAVEAPCDISVRGLDIGLSVKASIGISVFPKDGTTADALIKGADKAMYRAKQSASGYSFAR